jgi:hypothetical protein
VANGQRGQSEPQRRQTERRRPANLLYDRASEAGGIERALAQLDLAAIVTELAGLADRIRGDLAQLGDVGTLAGAIKDASELERAARSEMEAAQAAPSQLTASARRPRGSATPP